MQHMYAQLSQMPAINDESKHSEYPFSKYSKLERKLVTLYMDGWRFPSQLIHIEASKATEYRNPSILPYRPH